MKNLSKKLIIALGVMGLSVMSFADNGTRISLKEQARRAQNQNNNNKQKLIPVNNKNNNKNNNGIKPRNDDRDKHPLKIQEPKKQPKKKQPSKNSQPLKKQPPKDSTPLKKQPKNQSLKNPQPLRKTNNNNGPTKIVQYKDK